MNVKKISKLLALVLGGSLLSPLNSFAEPLRVCATIPELGGLASEVGGEEVSVTVFAKPSEDPHFVQGKPSFIKELSKADLLLVAGLELEIGWVPLLVRGARNERIREGEVGYLDLSTSIVPLDVPSGEIDRGMGDVHPLGNPHYLLDPANGLAVARAIKDRFAMLRPEAAEGFERRYGAFRSKLASAFVGDKLAAKYEIEKLLELQSLGGLYKFLEQQGESQDLSGWLAKMRPYAGSVVVADHNLWPYFARRFNLNIAGYLEPKPGVQPTTKHLEELIQRMNRERIGVILANPYYDPRHAKFVAERTRAKVAEMAHQMGSRLNSDDFLSWSEYNISTILKNLGS